MTRNPLDSVAPLSEWSVANRSNSISVPDFTGGSTGKLIQPVDMGRGTAGVGVLSWLGFFCGPSYNINGIVPYVALLYRKSQRQQCCKLRGNR